MANSFDDFIRSIGLPHKQAEELRAVRDQKTNGSNDGIVSDGNLELACKAAQGALKPEEVDISPLSTAAVEGNW